LEASDRDGEATGGVVVEIMLDYVSVDNGIDERLTLRPPSFVKQYEK